MTPYISIVIPTYNEERIIGQTLSAICSFVDKRAEIIVADGNSTDNTQQIVSRYPVRLVPSRRGRAIQMNTGAEKARGELLYFQHADCKPSANFLDTIQAVLNLPGVTAGAFSYAIDDSGLRFRMVSRFARWKARAHQSPYGDHGLFFRRKLFQHIGGFPENGPGEDLAIVQLLKDYGRVHVAREKIYSSPRCFQQVGLIRTLSGNRLIAMLFALGVPSRHLSRLYQYVR